MSVLAKAKRVDKDWGYEIWMANNEKENYCGKILHINGGETSSMHFHSEKHETFYVLEGELKVVLIDTETTAQTIHILKPGETFVIDRLFPHQLSTATDNAVKIIEISTLHKDEDSFRVWKGKTGE